MLINIKMLWIIKLMQLIEIKEKQRFTKELYDYEITIIIKQDELVNILL